MFRNNNNSLRRQRRLEQRRRLKMQEALWTAFALFILLMMFGDDLIQAAHDLVTSLPGTDEPVMQQTGDPWRDATREVGGDENIRKWYERGADPNAYPYDH